MNTAPQAVRSLSAGILSVALALGLTVPLVALAELSDEPLLGPGLRLRPAYDGSASQRAELVPVVRYYRQYWFARGDAARSPLAERALNYYASAGIAYRF